MADPVLVECTEGEWTKVATGVVTGFLRLPLNAGAFKFLWTSRDTTGTAPSNSDSTDGNLSLPLFDESNNVEISSINAQDFYVWIENADSDSLDKISLRVDL